ncbi:MAG: ABC transporter substrate-binding protein, partial [Clostridia bacterium]|nr:ABC transporter substrate-binding protein [Clostridia bacterium]
MKKVLALVLVLCMAFAVCGALAEGEPVGVECKGTGIELTVYTNSGSDGRREWLEERAAKDGYKLAIMETGANGVQDRLKNEAANPIADVVFGLNAIIWNDLIAHDVLVAYDAPSWTADVDPGLNDPNGYYYAIVKQAILLAYDTNQVAPEDAPKDWPDLWENE